MRPLHVRELGVGQLDWVFSPPGLPLVAKVPDAPPSTSVLVRGRAGTGKTTLALTLAHAVAVAGEGRTAYLSTEIAPADAWWKLEEMGIDAKRRAAWGEASPHHVVLVQHLAAATEANLASPDARMQAALEAAWAMVHEAPPAPPLRALVIDAFSLSGAHPEPRMRGDLLALIQVAEARGISVFLVEEAASAGSDWAAYLVDVVFELGWAEDPDTGALLRKLTCAKSRYVRSHPGPHDYGRWDNRFAVWPDMLPLVESLDDATAGTGGVLMAGHDDVGVVSGGIYASRVADKDPLASRLMRLLWLNQKLLSPARGPAGPGCTPWLAFTSPGTFEPFCRIIVVQHIPVFQARRRFHANFRDNLLALAQAGRTVVLHGSDDELRSVAVPYKLGVGSDEIGPLGALRNPLLTLVHGGVTRAALKQLYRDCTESTSTTHDITLWAGLSAVYAGSTAALAWLQSEHPRRDPALAPQLLPVALCAHGQRFEALAAFEQAQPERLELAVAAVSMLLDGQPGVDRLLTTLDNTPALPDSLRAELTLDIAAWFATQNLHDAARAHLDRARALLPTLVVDTPELDPLT